MEPDVGVTESNLRSVAMPILNKSEIESKIVEAKEKIPKSLEVYINDGSKWRLKLCVV